MFKIDQRCGVVLGRREGHASISIKVFTACPFFDENFKVAGGNAERKGVRACCVNSDLLRFQ